MKFYPKFLDKIRNNKDRLKRVVGIVSVAVGLRYAKINSISTSLSSNSTQRLETQYSDKESATVGDNSQSLIESESINYTRIKVDSGVLFIPRKYFQNEIPDYLKQAIQLRSGDLDLGKWKFGPGPRAKSDAIRNFKAKPSSRSIIQGVNGFVPQNTYCRYHENAPLSCKPKVKLSDSPFQDNGDDNQPPPENPQFDSSQYKGGPNPFIDKFDYDNPNYTRENTDFSSQKRINHAYDGHAEKCFGMKENRNKENLKTFEGKARSFIESPKTEKINGSYRYQTPTYLYKEKDGNLVAIVNATDNSFITIVNATESQLKSIRENKNFGLDTRPSMELTLRLRGPKNHN